MFAPVQILVGEAVLPANRLQTIDEISVGLHQTEGRLKILQRKNVRRPAAAVRSSEENVEIRRLAFEQSLVSPCVGRTAAMKIDMRRDDGARRKSGFYR